MYASGNKQKFAENILIPIIENIISKREAILLPNLNDIEEGLKKVFNEIVQTNKLEIN
ncbi:MAG: hypothetical protein BWY78_00649 [Alphaproteobacteria bacterium ADurb.Bin438]|nr:MAG: hypothetical protein BWY78_00649 [Alphaproteobacteria bacterium ADurb.Bin438]